MGMRRLLVVVLCGALTAGGSFPTTDDDRVVDLSVGAIATPLYAALLQLLIPV